MTLEQAITKVIDKYATLARDRYGAGANWNLFHGLDEAIDTVGMIYEIDSSRIRGRMIEEANEKLNTLLGVK